MSARVTTVDGNPGRIDELIMFVTQTVEPLVRQQPGSFELAAFSSWTARPVPPWRG